MKIGAVVQARTSSTRLPAKVLKKLPYGSGLTVLQQVIRRIKKAKFIDAVVVATTIEKDDDIITKIASDEGSLYYRGSKENVLSRYCEASKLYNLDVVVRITSDCPCIDFKLIDTVIKEHLDVKADYTANNIEKTFPAGLDIEVFNLEALKRAFREADKDYEFEHVTPYIRHTRPDEFKIHSITASHKYGDIRVTIDTEEDYALLCAVYDHLYDHNPFFGFTEITRLFEQKPWLKLINKKVIQKKIFDTVDGEIQEALKILDLQDLKRARNMLQNIYDKKL